MTALLKCGPDQYSDIIKKMQLELVRHISHYFCVCLFRFHFVFNPFQKTLNKDHQTQSAELCQLLAEKMFDGRDPAAHNITV